MADRRTKPLPKWRLALARAIGLQHWPQPFRRYLVHRCLPRWRVRDFPFEVRFFGLRFRGNAGNSLEYEVLKRGAFEHGILLFMARVAALSNGDRGIFVDVGANIGQHSLFMSLHAAGVVAFEPLDFLADRFEALMRLNRVDDVDLRRVALSDQSGTGLIALPRPDNLGIGTLDLTSPSAEGAGTVAIPLRKGDDELRELGGRPIFLIKIDVEGHELAVLAGLRQTLARHRPVVVLETLNARREDYAALRDAFPQSYRWFSAEKLYKPQIIAKRWDGIAHCEQAIVVPEGHPILALLP